MPLGISAPSAQPFSLPYPTQKHTNTKKYSI